MLVLNPSKTRGEFDAALITLADLRQAQARLRGIARRTPIIETEFPARGRIYLKAESMQPIGSFKLRGAYNKAASLSRDQLKRGIITYSSGNHAQGVAYAARALGAKAVIVMPANAPAIKRKATEALGAEIVTVGPASAERQAKAEELTVIHGYTIIPPFDDPAIIAGQGTCGMEILEDLPEIDLILVPTGGGGLLSGIAAAIKYMRPETQVWGVEPEFAADATESIASGTVVRYTAEQTSRTLADGLRTQHIGELNFAHIRAFVDGIITVTEAEISAAMRAALLDAKLVAEPSGAVALAAALYHAEELQATEKSICVVLSGGNVEPELLAKILCPDVVCREIVS